MARSKSNHTKGVSLAKGPASIVGIVLIVAGIYFLIFGSHSFSTNPVDGTVNGQESLGFETNAWMALGILAAGALLLFGAPLHWAAKSLSLVVGLVLGAASVILLVDGDDVFGIAAGNGLLALALGVGAAVLLVTALLPRVGKKDKGDHDHGRRDDDHVGRREDTGRVHRAPAAPVGAAGHDGAGHDGRAHDARTLHEDERTARVGHDEPRPTDTATDRRAQEGAVSPDRRGR